MDVKAFLPGSLVDVRPTKDQILKIIKCFIGLIYQKPAIFSGVKINGHSSYKLARKNLHCKIDDQSWYNWTRVLGT